LALEDP